MGVEVSPLDQWDAEDAEVVRPYREMRHDRVELSRRENLPLDSESVGVALTVRRQRIGDGGCLDPGTARARRSTSS